MEHWAATMWSKRPGEWENVSITICTMVNLDSYSWQLNWTWSGSNFVLISMLDTLRTIHHESSKHSFDYYHSNTTLSLQTLDRFRFVYWELPWFERFITNKSQLYYTYFINSWFCKMWNDSSMFFKMINKVIA